MRDELSPPVELDPPTCSSRRRRSLHRGALRFQRDVSADGRVFHRVLLFSLTVESLDVDVARGAVRDCMKQLRDVQPGLRYLWWAEFQKRGAIHYHGVLVEPSFDFERDARAWFDRHWPHAKVQAWVEWRSAAWFKVAAGAYVLKDVRKLNGKRYEQDYERMPAHWKTFSSHRLMFSAEEHKPHEPRTYVAIEAGGRRVLAFAREEHVPAFGGCRLVRDLVIRRRRKTLARPRPRAPSRQAVSMVR